MQALLQIGASSASAALALSDRGGETSADNLLSVLLAQQTCGQLSADQVQKLYHSFVAFKDLRQTFTLSAYLGTSSDADAVQ